MNNPGLIVWLLLCLGPAILFIAVEFVCSCCFNRDGDDDQLPDEQLEASPSNAQPPPEEAVQMASIAIILLDYITYPRQNNYSASHSLSGGGRGGGGGSTEEAGRTSSASEEDCAICLGPLEDGDWCSVMPICRHEFHRECIANWLMAYNNTCPLCRAQLQWSAVAQDMV